MEIAIPSLTEEKTEEEFQAEQSAADARFQSCGGNEDVEGFVLLESFRYF